MGKAARSKGSRGQTAAANLLRDRDWEVEVLTCGMMHEDLIATLPEFEKPDMFYLADAGTRYSVEVKNCKSITTAHRAQAMEQAKKRKLPWMLMSHIERTSCWLIQRQGLDPVIWKEKENEAIYPHQNGTD